MLVSPHASQARGGSVAMSTLYLRAFCARQNVDKDVYGVHRQLCFCTSRLPTRALVRVAWLHMHKTLTHLWLLLLHCGSCWVRHWPQSGVQPLIEHGVPGGAAQAVHHAALLIRGEGACRANRSSQVGC